MSIYVPMFVKQRSMIMNKADLVITDYRDDDYYKFDHIEREDFGIILGFTCGNSSYDNFYDDTHFNTNGAINMKKVLLNCIEKIYKQKAH